MQRKYLTPQTGTNTYFPHGKAKELDIYRPKHFGDMVGIDYDGQDYTVNRLWLVTADLSDFDHAYIASKPDVFVFPEDHKTSIDPAPLQAYLDGHRLPVGKLHAGHTYKDVIDKIKHQVTATQILCGLHRVHKFAGLTVDTKFSELAAVVQDLMKANPAAHDSIFDILSKTSAALDSKK